MAKLKGDMQLSTLVNILYGNTAITIYDKDDNIIFYGYIASLHNEETIDFDSYISELEIDHRVRVILK